jgi:putative FmdB family regulatory protein
VPRYSYACTECDHRFDAVQAFTDDALTTCPVCSGRLRKLFNSVGVVFKGPGFYRTDSRLPSSKDSSGGEKVASGGESPSKKETSKENSSSSGSSKPESSSAPAAAAS